MSTDTIQNKICELEKKIAKKKKKLIKLKQQLPDEEIENYEFRNWQGQIVTLSELFGDSDELILIHNMGKRCPYCTLWADGFNGIVNHMENRAGFVVISPDDPDVQKAFATGRGWKFKMASCAGTSFAKDLNFMDEKEAYWPGVSALYKDDAGKIFRSAYSYFGPGDDFCSAWPFFDLLKKGINEWQPKFEYK
ncbi:MAG: DUF899 family protein [candidate division Zixibacteria bacterium]|nr:DUF899 family protein [candidate division Zixibacteria bacterium]